MCGIVGAVSIVPVHDFDTKLSRLHHRGPNGRGKLAVDLPWSRYVMLGMTRLAIVDRRPLEVPFDFRPSCGVVLAFNGEVYNWRELRTELSDGLPWQTDCDAEVVARGWRRWGVEMLGRLNGMFAFALIDTVAGELVLARDRAGEKPLYYAERHGLLSFASEIKALPGIQLHEYPCDDMETLEFDCGPTTPFNGVLSLQPGHFVRLSRAGQVLRPRTWWSLPTDTQPVAELADVAEEAEALVIDAVRLRASADVPVAVQLSGGLDSAIIQAVANCERLYTVTFPEDGVDNLELARAAAGGVEPRTVTFGIHGLMDALPSIAWHLDTPATWTAACQWFMAKQMAADGIVVALSGEGADEVFGGYARYKALRWLDEMQQDPALAGYGVMLDRMLGGGDPLVALLDRGVTAEASEHAERLVMRHGGDGGGGRPAQMARIDWHTTMQVLLRMADRMATAHSMENRSPFLDYRLVEFGARLPTSMKVDARKGTKLVLREVARRLGVPRQITDEQHKRGLFLPWSKWTGAPEWDRHAFSWTMQQAWRRAFFSSS